MLLNKQLHARRRSGTMTGTGIGIEGGMPIEAWDALEARQARSTKFEEIGDVAVLVTSPKMSLVNGANSFVDRGFSINQA